MSESKTSVPILSKTERTKLWDSMATDAKAIRSAKYYQGLPLHPYCIPTKDERLYITHSGLIQSESNPMIHYTLSHYPLAEDADGTPSPVNGYVITVWESEGSQYGFDRKYQKKATFTPPFAHYDPLLCHTYNNKGGVVKLSDADKYELTTKGIPSWLKDMRKSLESISPEPLLRTLQEKLAGPEGKSEGIKNTIDVNVREIKELYMTGAMHSEVSRLGPNDGSKVGGVMEYPFSEKDDEHVVPTEWPIEYISDVPQMAFQLVEYDNRCLEESIKGRIHTTALRVILDQRHAIPNAVKSGVSNERGLKIQSIMYEFNLDSKHLGQCTKSYTSDGLNKYFDAAMANSEEANLDEGKPLQMIDSYLQLMVKAIKQRRGTV